MGKKYLIDEETLMAQADALRDKLRTTDELQVSDFADHIDEIFSPDLTAEHYYYSSSGGTDIDDIGDEDALLNNFSTDSLISHSGVENIYDAMSYFCAGNMVYENASSDGDRFASIDDSDFDADGNATIECVIDGNGYRLSIHREVLE